jgi:hypothetical protein
VSALHLLVKHKDSRNPSSWREKKITRSREEAIEKIKTFQKQILEGQNFSEVARIHRLEHLSGILLLINYILSAFFIYLPLMEGFCFNKWNLESYSYDICGY